DRDDSRQGVAPDAYVMGFKLTPQELVVGHTLELFQWIFRAPPTEIGQFERPVPNILEHQQSKGGLLARNFPPGGVTALDGRGMLLLCLVPPPLPMCPVPRAPRARGNGGGRRAHCRLLWGHTGHDTGGPECDCGKLVLWFAQLLIHICPLLR